LHTLIALPHIKEKFFGKNWWEAYSGFTGLIARGLLLILLTLLF